MALDSSQLPWSSIKNAVLNMLRENPDGLAEQALLKELQKKQIDPVFENYNESELSLFQAHFVLFHALYLIRDQLQKSNQACLEIGPLKVRLWPYKQGEISLQAHDPLGAYYLNLNNLHQMTAGEVQRLIDSFWQRLQNNNQRKQALAELGLQDPVDDKTIKQAYRKMAMRHHPDRGGDKTKLQEVNAAFGKLRK